ncbi:MAG: CDP-glucose 4,6-dehydratase [Synergistaceae bacterium]|nr:CDP-glucose 4,6-dehydratase [Synergistaceae bacterium]
MEDVGMKDFWQGKKVLLTGHTGFKGSWLLSCLSSWGAEVAGYSVDVPTEPSMYRLLRLENQCRSFMGDICDRERLIAVFEDFSPEIVFHLAAQTLVRRSYTAPYETYRTNVLGTLNVLDAACKNRVRVFVNVTTDKCYENKEWEWGYRENDPLGGDDPYSASKGCSEILTASWRKSFASDKKEQGTAIATARAGNVIGGGDWGEDRLVPDCIRALTAGKPIELRNPRSIRPWQFVLEPLWGYMFLARCLYHEPEKYSGAWNFGPSISEIITTEELAQRVMSAWGKGEIIRRINPNNPSESNVLRLDSSKAAFYLNWRQHLTLRKTIERTLDWYRLCYSSSNAAELIALTSRQIEDYFQENYSKGKGSNFNAE